MREIKNERREKGREGEIRISSAELILDPFVQAKIFGLNNYGAECDRKQFQNEKVFILGAILLCINYGAQYWNL